MKWDAGHQILKKKAEAREKRNTVDGHLQVVLQIVEHIAERKVEGNQGQSQDLGPEIFSLALIHMIEDAGIDQAVALHMALEENEVEVVQGVEGNPIEFRDLGQKAEQEVSRSRPRPRSHSRSSERSSHRRTRSRSRDRERRKGRDKEKREKEKDKCKDKELHNIKRGESGNIKAGLEHLPPAEQAKARLQLVLEAAAKADEALKAKERNEEEAKRRKEEDQATLVEQVKRVKEIEAIESDSFVQQTFRSSKEVKKSVEPGDVKHTTAASGPASVVADPPSTEKEIDPSSIPTTIKYQDDNSLAHPNLFIEKADAEEKWFKRLIALRQERLMGSPVA
ncbi:serine/Arginine-related protein 53 [Prionailurus iriomotensis]